MSERVQGHPLWGLVQQAEDAAKSLPPQAAQINPQIERRLQRVLTVLRQSLESVDGDIIADVTLQNFFNWLQPVFNEINNLRANPAAAPQYINNLVGPLDAITQNLHQLLPPFPSANLLATMVDDGQNRLDRMAQMGAEAQERTRATIDQLRDELARAREVTDDGLKQVKERQSQVDELVSQMGGRATSSDWLGTATTEKADADRWRVFTFLFSALTLIISIGLLLDVSPGSWTSIASHAGGIIPAALITVYAGRQAAEHRAQERRARSLGLQLASLGAFLVDLPENSRAEIKGFVARQIFQANPAKTEAADGYPSSQDLFRIVTELVSKLPQQGLGPHT